MITAMADELRSQSMVVLGPMMPNLSQRFTESSSSRKKETRFDVIALASKSLLWHNGSCTQHVRQLRSQWLGRPQCPNMQKPLSGHTSEQATC